VRQREPFFEDASSGTTAKPRRHLRNEDLVNRVQNLEHMCSERIPKLGEQDGSQGTKRLDDDLTASRWDADHQRRRAFCRQAKRN